MGKKIRIYLSTLLTAYHHYQRIFKERREIKIIIMDNLIEAIKQLKKEKMQSFWGTTPRRVKTRHSRLCRRQSGSGTMGGKDGG